MIRNFRTTRMNGSLGMREDDLGMAVDDQIRRVGRIPSLHEPIAGLEADPLEHGGQELHTPNGSGAAAVVAPETRADASAYFLARLIE
jgi:hypothetical protein